MGKNVLDTFRNPEIQNFPKIRYWLPEANITAEYLRKDLQDIKERGFSGVEVVPMLVDRSIYNDQEKFWASKHWFDSIEVILKEAKVQNLTVDFGISLMWPISMPNIANADDPATLYELTYGFKKLGGWGHYEGCIPDKRTTRAEGTSKLIKVTAYQIDKNNALLDETFIDLTDHVNNSKVDYFFPESPNQWILFSFWEQPAAQKVNGNYVIDHFSRKGAQKCCDFWMEKMEPIIRKYPEQCESIFCDSLEYDACQDWTRNFLDIFKKMKNYDLVKYLPGLRKENVFPKTDSPNFNFQNQDRQNSVINDYYDVLTKLYNENHLIPLREMAHDMGMTLRYQVAYNKTLEVELSASNVDIPEGEALNRSTIDNLKLMSGATHLDDKKIYSYECSAEFGNAYGQTFEDILWWIKRGYVGGMNSQVLHGAVYNGQLDNCPWPGYEPFGKYVSNYWNRTLSKEASMHNMAYVARVNSIMRLSPKVDLAIIHEGYINDGKGSDGDHIVKDQGLLISHGYNYDLISPSLMKKFETMFTNENSFLGGPQYKALVYPFSGEGSLNTLKNLTEMASSKAPIYIILEKRDHLLLEGDPACLDLLSNLSEKSFFHFVNSYTGLLDAFKNNGIYPDCQFDEPEDIATIHTRDSENDYFILYNYNKVRIEDDEGKKKFIATTFQPKIDKESEFSRKSIRIKVPENKDIIQLNPESGEIFQLNTIIDSQQQRICSINFEPDELKIIGFTDESKSANIVPWKMNIGDSKLERMKLYVSEVSSYAVAEKNNEKNSFYDFVWEKQSSSKLNEICERKEYNYRLSNIDSSNHALLIFEGDFDSCLVEVNTKKIPLVSHPGRFKVDLSQYLFQGDNTVKIIIYSSLYNRLSQNSKSFGLNEDSVSLLWNEHFE